MDAIGQSNPTGWPLAVNIDANAGWKKAMKRSSCGIITQSRRVAESHSRDLVWMHIIAGPNRHRAIMLSEPPTPDPPVSSARCEEKESQHRLYSVASVSH